MSKNKQSVSEAQSATKSKVALNSAEDYSPSSQIAKAYSAGYFPSFTHQRLFHAIAAALGGKDEGSVDFAKVLEDAGMHRSSALQIIRHMSNFGILEVSFNSSHVIGEARKSWAHIKILAQPRTQRFAQKRVMRLFYSVTASSSFSRLYLRLTNKAAQ